MIENDNEFGVVFNRSDGRILRVYGPDGSEVKSARLTEKVLQKNDLSSLDLIASQTGQIQFIHNPERSVCCIVHMGRLYCWCG